MWRNLGVWIFWSLAVCLSLGDAAAAGAAEVVHPASPSKTPGGGAPVGVEGTVEAVTGTVEELTEGEPSSDPLEEPAPEDPEVDAPAAADAGKTPTPAASPTAGKPTAVNPAGSPPAAKADGGSSGSKSPEAANAATPNPGRSGVSAAEATGGDRTVQTAPTDEAISDQPPTSPDGAEGTVDAQVPERTGDAKPAAAHEPTGRKAAAKRTGKSDDADSPAPAESSAPDAPARTEDPPPSATGSTSVSDLTHEHSTFATIFFLVLLGAGVLIVTAVARRELGMKVLPRLPRSGMRRPTSTAESRAESTPEELTPQESWSSVR